MKWNKGVRLFPSIRTFASPSVGLVAILALTFYLRLLLFGQSIDGDAGNMGYLAWRMSEGEVLVDLEGPGKPPLSSMAYALFIHFFGPSPMGLKIFGTLFILMAVLAIYWVASQAYGKGVGLFAALLFGIFSSGPMIEGGSVNLETFLHFPYILAIGFFLKASRSNRLRWYFLPGLAGGAAMLVKQVGGIVFIIFLFAGFHEWLRRKESHPLKEWSCRYILLGAGALLPLSGVLIFYSSHGYSLGQLYHSLWISNLQYIRRGYEYTYFLSEFFSSMKRVLPENSLLWIGTLFSGAYLVRKNWHGEWRTTDWVLLVWAIGSFGILWITGTFFWHYFLQILPPFCVFTAFGLVTAWRFSKSLPLRLKSAVLGIGAIILMASLILLIKTDYPFYFSYHPVEQTVFQYKVREGVIDGYGVYNIVQQEIAFYIRDHSDPQETIYVWGIAPQVYYLAQRRAATRYRNNYNMSQLVTRYPLKALAAYAPMVMEEIRRSPPAYIVQIFRLEDFPELQDFVRDHYTVVKRMEAPMPSFRIHLYRRRSDIRKSRDTN